MKNIKAFTLAEIMIVLSVVGILTAILLLTAFQSAPDENALKFKKANSILGTAIREMVNSDKYYKSGDLALKPDGTEVPVEYFCASLSDIMSTKQVNCRDTANDGYAYFDFETKDLDLAPIDEACVETQPATDDDADIITVDGVIWYESSPGTTFAEKDADDKRMFSAPNETPAYEDEYGFDSMYKILCIDVDGLNKGEDPFGYGIRADGKILNGPRANEWIKKSVQKDN